MAQATHIHSRLLTRAEVAELFGVDPSTVTRWADSGKLPFVRTLGGHRRYEKSAVLALASKLPTEEKRMKKTTIIIPAMFGDHHVAQVRKILSEIKGISAVFASSAFNEVVIAFDEGLTSEDQITAVLASAGYPPGSGADTDLVIAVDHKFAKVHRAMNTENEQYKFNLPSWRTESRRPCPGFELRPIGGEHPADQ